MTNEKIRASRARIYAPPEGVAADKQVHVYIYDVFNDAFLADHKAFEQRHLRARVEHQFRAAGAAIGHDPGRQDLGVDLAELALEQLVEHPLELEPALVVHDLHAAAQFLA